jgi:radical SAM superfamily enzyme YgiQ (UPF0313 family)
MADVLLSTLNAKYLHTAFGLRYLYANLGELRSRAAIKEFDINQRVHDIAEDILAQEPKVLGLGVYIWNATPMLELVSILKRLAPELVIVLGGPEVSYETEAQTVCALADYIVCGEGEWAFADLAARLLRGERLETKILKPAPPEVTELALPYAFYNDDDCAHRVIYVEASRGCPFSCEFCLSSLDVRVRQFPLEPFLAQMDALMARGVRQFKFVDRTFNLQVETSRRILSFFLERIETVPDLFVHFEMIPDRLPAALREIIARFPKGALQFEVGVQTLSQEVETRISRRQNQERMAENFAFLRDDTGVHVHADLIAGLPGEDLQSFARGFDRLHAMGAQEIQLGILKRLRGTPIVRHDAEFGMVYSPTPPYEILRTFAMDFATLQRIKRFAKYWDIFKNSGNFQDTMALLFSSSGSAFTSFMTFCDWLHPRLGKTWGIALHRQYELVWDFMCEGTSDKRSLARTLLNDYVRGGRPDHPAWMLEHLHDEDKALLPRRNPNRRSLPKRQARHVAEGAEGLS